METLPENCTIQDVETADIETIYYSFNSNKKEYTLSVIIAMAEQLTMRDTHNDH